MYTVDASVWVNAFDQREPGHLGSRQCLDVLRVHALPIIVLHLVLVEVAGAISRTRRTPAQAEAFALALSRLPYMTVRVLDEGCAVQALTLAAQGHAVFKARADCPWERGRLARFGSGQDGRAPRQDGQSLAATGELNDPAGGPACLAWRRCGLWGRGARSREYAGHLRQ